jgi:hypothetical protein
LVELRPTSENKCVRYSEKMPLIIKVKFGRKIKKFWE